MVALDGGERELVRHLAVFLLDEISVWLGWCHRVFPLFKCSKMLRLVLPYTTFEDGNAAQSGSLRLNLRHGMRRVLLTLTLNIGITLDPHSAIHLTPRHLEKFLERIIWQIFIYALVSQFPEIFGRGF